MIDLTPEVIERAGLKAWPAIEVEWDGAWVRRAANGYTQRANSVQSMDPTDDTDAEARLANSQVWFEARGLQPIFRQTPLAGPNTLAVLKAARWDTVDASHLFAMKLKEMEPDERGRIYEILDTQFLAAQQRLRGYSNEKLDRLKALLSVIKVPVCGIVFYSEDGQPAASAIMDVADDIVITGNVITDPTQRRKGYATAMMRTGLAWARSQGAKVAALNVAADNPGGQALYRSLGYVHQYDYTYRIPARP